MTVADSTTERILQACRAWLKLAAARTPLTDAQVRIADAPGPRPTGGYLTVKVLAADTPVGSRQCVNRAGDRVTVGDGDPGDDYTIYVDGDAYGYVRLDTDTNTTVAAALVALINAGNEDLYAVSSGAIISIGGRLDAPATSVGGANLTLVEGAVPYSVARSLRTCTLSIQGYGHASLAWLERAFMRIDTPEVRALNDAAGVYFDSVSGLTDLSAFLDTTFEARYGRDAIATYVIIEDPSFETALGEVVTTATVNRYASDPAPFVSVTTTTV